jgi:hypothetical protein
MASAKNYDKKLKELNDSRDAAKSPGVVSTLNDAIAQTEQSLALCGKLEESWTEATKVLIDRDRQKQALEDAAMETMRRTLAEVTAAVAASAGENPKVAIKSLDLARLRIETLRLELKASEAASRLSAVARENAMLPATVPPKLIDWLFDGVWKPGRRDFDDDAMVQGADFIVGLIPFAGNVYSGVRALWNIGRARRAALAAWDAESLYIESYGAALSLWQGAALEAISVCDTIVETGA